MLLSRSGLVFVVGALVLVVVGSFPSVARAAIPDFLADVPGLVTPPTRREFTEASGIPVWTRTCVSKESVESLYDHFLKRFKAAGLYLAPEAQRHQPRRGAQLTGTEPVDQQSVTVFLQPSGAGTTIVLGEADLSKGLSRNLATFAPVHPTAEPVTTANFEATRMMGYKAKAGAEDLKRFYRAALKEKGYSEREELVFVGGGQKLTVNLTEKGPGETLVQVLQELAPK